MRATSAQQARLGLVVGGAGCFVLVALAVLLQHVFGMEPCSWCVLQRLIFLLVGVGCLTAAWLPVGRSVRAALASLSTLLAISGVAAALYQQFVASASASCALTLADRIVMALSLHEVAPWLFMPTAPCNEANVALLGLPFAVWSAIAFGLLSAVSAWSAKRLYAADTEAR